MVSFALRRPISLLMTVMAPALVGFLTRATRAAASPFHGRTTPTKTAVFVACRRVIKF
jgi:hypothetical protein